MGLWYSRPGEVGFAGLRAGWRVAIFLLLLAGVPVACLWGLRAAGLLAQGASNTHAAAGLAPLNTGITEAGLFLWVAIVTLIMSRLERRPFGDYGLPGRAAFRGYFWQGVLWGVVSLSVVLLLIKASGDFNFGAVGLSGAALPGYAVGWGLAFLAVGFFEEFCFRGYALVTLNGGMGFWPAAVVLSAIFGGTHLGNGGESYIGALTAGLIGLFFCFTWRRTGSLWFAVGLHAAWDYCESFVYGVPDSGAITPGRLLQPAFHGSRWITGGTVGPEGSLWVLMVIAALFALFAVRFPPAAPASAAMPSPRSTASSEA